MVLGRAVSFIRRFDYRVSLFVKINGLIVMLFIPILILYAFTSNVAFNVVSNELKLSNAKQLSFLSSQIDARIEQMMDFASTFSRDPNVQKFNGLPLWEDRYDKMQTRFAIQEKIALQSTPSMENIWPVRYAVYSMHNKDVLNNYNSSLQYDEQYLKRNMTARWNYGDGKPVSAGQQQAFYWFYSNSGGKLSSFSAGGLVVVASFGAENIQNLLDRFKEGGNGDPFFYRKGQRAIFNRSADKPLTEALIGQLDGSAITASFQRIVRLHDKDYLVSAVKSPHLNWYLVDYVPLEQILQPISHSRNWFYFTMVLLLCIGVSASIVLYRNVQLPIKQLIRGLKRVSRGDFSVRIRETGNFEFSFLFERFNSMSRQIHELIENVLNERLRAREATLKQLQAQINPHFLYNCLGYIINMAQMKDEEAVVSMAYNLSAYYRYSTRMEKPTASLREEIELLIHYLDIQKLRNGRIDYTIDIPEEMMLLPVPRLLLQPIAENAVIHGVGKSYQSGAIRITGTADNGGYTLHVDDDGPGMTEDRLAELNRRLSEPLQENTGFGLWNTNQRIIHQLGEHAHLIFMRSPLGGVRSEIAWPIAEEEQPHSRSEGDRHHANDHCRR